MSFNIPQTRLYQFLREKRRRLVFVQTKYFCDFSFIHINKTGGSSIEGALKAPLIHETALTFRDRIGTERWDKRFSFAIVRNPWDRAVSQFHYRRMTNQTGLSDTSLLFNDWIRNVFLTRSPQFMNEEIMFLPQIEWVSDEEGNIMVDYIGKFENLQQSWDDISERLNRQPSRLPHKKKSSRGDYQSYYDEESKDIVGDFFKRDIEAFGYSF